MNISFINIIFFMFLISSAYYINFKNSSPLFAHTDGGVHTAETAHDLESFYTFPRPDEQSYEYFKQSTEEQFILQDTMLWVSLRQLVPSLAEDRVLKVLDLVRRKSGLWDLEDRSLPSKDCKRAVTIYYIASEQEIFNILGLDLISAKTLFHHFENTLQKPPVYHVYESGIPLISFHLSSIDFSYALCYLKINSDHLINEGIINLKSGIEFFTD